MKIDTLPIGLYQENIYILHDHSHVLIIDPGRYAKEIASHIRDDETVDGIILTHGHEDHTGAADDLAEMYDCGVWLHDADRQLVSPDAVNAFGSYAGLVYAKTNHLEGDMEIGTFKVTVYHTPGHTSGSVCIRYRNVLFSGDTLFASSVGRTDLFSGNDEEMVETIRFLKTLPRDLKVYPGHGPATTIAQELRVNPYLVYERV